MAATKTVAALPAAQPSTKSKGILLIALIVAVAIGAYLPTLLAESSLLSIMTQATIYAILATSVGFLFHQNGLVSFGQAGYFGLAAYMMALLVTHKVVTPELAILLAVVVPMMLAALLSTIVLRLSGVAFSMVTLAIAQAGHELVLRWRSLANGEDGIVLRMPKYLFGFDSAGIQTSEIMFGICWAVLAIIVLCYYLFTNSSYGILTLAIRENEERARFIGYGTVVPRAVIYTVASTMSAISGTLFALYNGFVSPETMHWALSGEALVMAIVGGTGQVWGAALGAVLLFWFKNVVGDVTENWQAIVGFTMIVSTVWLRGGISGAISNLYKRINGGRG
jgi:branched-chain amino acid transport system permease protein